MSLAVVSGVPGWLGTRLVEALARGAKFRSMETGPRRVRSIVHPAMSESALAGAAAVGEVFRADLRDASALRGACAGATTVFHTAGVIHPRRVAELYDVNVRGTQNLLEEAISSGVERFVYVSSNAPSGFNASPSRLMREDDPPRPVLNYGRSKLQAEGLVLAAHGAGRIEGVVVRPCWFYGPNQPARQSRFFRMIQGGRPIVIGRGDNLRSLSYIENTVQGLLLAADVEKAAGRVYWITDRRPYSFIEIVETVGALLGVRVRPRHLPGISSGVARLIDAAIQRTGLYNQEIHVAGELGASIAVAIDAARNDLGYDPEVELEQGMRASIEWCRRNAILP